MSAETEIYTALSAAAPVTALIGTRLYPDFLTQEITLPAVVYQRAGTEPVLTIHNNTQVAARATMELWSLAATRIGAEGLADVLRNALPPSFVLTDRRPEFDEQTLTYSTVLTCDFWE